MAEEPVVPDFVPDNLAPVPCDLCQVEEGGQGDPTSRKVLCESCRWQYPLIRGWWERPRA